MENDVAWYSHCTTKKLRHRRPELLWRRGWPWPRMDPVVWCEPVDPVGRVRPVPKCAKSCWVCWLQATIHKIETSYPASSPARWGNNKWTSFYHDFSYPARECEPGFSAEEMKLSNGSEGLCHSLSLVSLVREAESPKMADMIRHGCWGKDYDHLAQEGVSCGQRLASDRCLSNSSCLFCWETTRRKNSERKTWVPRKIWQRILLSKQPAIGTTLEWLRHNYREHCKY
jgi:hypothetical protein